MALRDHPQHLGAVGFWAKEVGVNDQRGFFAVSGAVANGQNVQQQKDGLVRCDSEKIGPYGFHRWDAVAGVCSCGSTDQPEPAMGHHIITLDNLATVAVVIEALPHGYILYFELHDIAAEEECVQMPHSDCARTLQELFRLLAEWDFAYTELGSTELIAETCHGILQTLEMPESVRSFLLNDMPDEKVSRFIKGDPDARSRAPLPDIPALPTDFDEWLEQKILHSLPLGARTAS